MTIIIAALSGEDYDEGDDFKNYSLVALSGSTGPIWDYTVEYRA